MYLFKTATWRGDATFGPLQLNKEVCLSLQLLSYLCNACLFFLYDPLKSPYIEQSTSMVVVLNNSLGS